MYENVQSQSLLTPNQLFEAMQLDSENENQEPETSITNSQNSVVSVDYVLNPTQIKVEKDIKLEKNDVENHENSVLYGNYECRICGQEFENEVELIHHTDVKDLFTLLMNSVHVEKTEREKIGQTVDQSDHFFECENCHQRFTTKSKLNLHNCQQLTVHESPKTANVSSEMLSQQAKFLCDICEEPFGFSFLLRDHVKSTHDY